MATATAAASGRSCRCGANGDQTDRARARRDPVQTGEVSTKRLGEVALAVPEPSNGVRPSSPATAPRDEPLIAICMTTYNPPARTSFGRQIESLRDQTHAQLDLPGQRRLLAAGPLRRDPRASLTATTASSSPRPESGSATTATSSACSGLFPPEAELVALCDQDDRWHPDKLEALRDALEPGVTLAYSDMNLVDDDGELLSPDLLDRSPRRTTRT